MNANDAFLLASEFKALYDAWEPSPAEVDLYVDLFQRFDKDLVDEVMRKYRVSPAGDRRVPKISALRGLLFKAAAEKAAQGGKIKSGPRLAYRIESADGKYKLEFWWPAGSVMPEWDELLEKHASKALSKVVEVYAGEWIIVRPEPDKPMGQLRGRQAMLEAEAIIAMQAEETLGKRWLAGYYERKAKLADLVSAVAKSTVAKDMPRKPVKLMVLEMMAGVRAEEAKVLDPKPLPECEHAGLSDEQFFAANPVELDGVF